MGTGQYLRQEYLYRPLPLHICSAGQYSMACFGTTFFTGGAAFATQTWPANNRAVYMPVSIPSPFVIARFMVVNNNATGNIDVGIYNFAGSRLLSTGSQSRTGTDVVQYYDVTDTAFRPGQYYLALVCSTTSGSFYRVGGASAVSAKTGGVLQEDLGATTLPTTMTPVTNSNGMFFAFGFTQSGTL